MRFLSGADDTNVNGSRQALHMQSLSVSFREHRVHAYKKTAAAHPVTAPSVCVKSLDRFVRQPVFSVVSPFGCAYGILTARNIPVVLYAFILPPSSGRSANTHCAPPVKPIYRTVWYINLPAGRLPRVPFCHCHPCIRGRWFCPLVFTERTT